MASGGDKIGSPRRGDGSLCPLNNPPWRVAASNEDPCRAQMVSPITPSTATCRRGGNEEPVVAVNGSSAPLQSPHVERRQREESRVAQRFPLPLQITRGDSCRGCRGREKRGPIGKPLHTSSIGRGTGIVLHICPHPSRGSMSANVS